MNDLLLFTDMHISDKPLNGIDTISCFIKVLKHSSYTTKPDGIILCGDLSQDGLESDYQLMCREINHHLPEKTIYAIAGNHDNQTNLENTLANQKNIRYLSNEIIETDSHSLIFINSNIHGKTEGHISATTLSWLQQVLEKSNKPVYIFTHHHTLPIDRKIDNYIINNRIDFKNALKPYAKNVKAVICGHTHKFTMKDYDNMKFITLPATCMQYNSKTKFEPENIQMYSTLNLQSGEIEIIEA